MNIKKELIKASIEDLKNRRDKLLKRKKQMEVNIKIKDSQIRTAESVLE